MKILVTGAAGYIGSVVTTRLIESGHAVVAFDNLSNGNRDAVHEAAEFIEGDLLVADDLNRALSGGIDGVAHLAAEALIDESIRDPGLFYRANLVGGLNLLDAMLRHNVKRLVFSSTAAVYGEPEAIPIPESASCSPVNAYGDSKLAFERALSWYHRAHDIRYVTFRYFNVCGATERNGEMRAAETHLIPIVLKVAAGRLEALNLFGTDYPTPDGTCIRDYIHVFDVANAHLLALEKVEALQEQVLNIGNDAGYSNLEVVEAARRVTGHQIPALASPRRPGDPARLVASNRLAREVLGWQPAYADLNEMVATSWAWAQSHEAATI